MGAGFGAVIRLMPSALAVIGAEPSKTVVIPKRSEGSAVVL